MTTRSLTRRLLGYRPRRVTRPLWLLIALLVAGSCIAVPPAYAAAVPEILYVSGDRIMRYSASTGAISTRERVSSRRLRRGTPHVPERRSLGLAATVPRGRILPRLSGRTRHRNPEQPPHQQRPGLLCASLPRRHSANVCSRRPRSHGWFAYRTPSCTTSSRTPPSPCPTWETPATGHRTGTVFVFVSYPLASQDPQGVMLYTKNLTGLQFKVPTAKLVTPGEVNIYSPRWSPNGSWIAFQRVDFGAGTVDIVLTDPAGISEELLATLPLETTGRGMGWPPDPSGDRLLVERIVPGGGPFYLESVPGVGPTMPIDPIVHAALSWMPPKDFTDVSVNSPNAEAIYDLSAFGVMGGYDDGTFRPDNPVLRAQYAKMITIALAIHDAPWTGWNSPHFSDVPRPAAQDESMRYPFDFVEEAAIGGLVKGYSDGQFRQWQPISRSQLALMIARAGSVDLQPAGAAAKAAFNDLTGLSQETRDAIALCYENGIILGKTPGMFAPYAQATRTHVALMTWRFMKALGMAE